MPPYREPLDLKQRGPPQDPKLGRSLQNAAGELGLPVSKLIEIAGLSIGRPTAELGWIERFLGKSRLSQQEIARLNDMMEVVARVADWAGGPREALAWYVGKPIPALDGMTPQLLVNSGKTAALRIYLDHIAVGGFA